MKPKVIHKKYPKARKEHICCECNKQIFAGERYLYIEMLVYRRWSRFKMCLTCDEKKKED
jgi:hypothetical protein